MTAHRLHALSVALVAISVQAAAGSWQVRADHPAQATLGMTLPGSSGATPETAGQSITITD